MTETDDKLLKQFFGEQKQEIEDNGFSRRVMRNLPGRNHRLVQAWGAACKPPSVHCAKYLSRWSSKVPQQDSTRNPCISPLWYLPSSERARHGRWHNTQRSYESNVGYSI